MDERDTLDEARWRDQLEIDDGAAVESDSGKSGAEELDEDEAAEEGGEVDEVCHLMVLWILLTL